MNTKIMIILMVAAATFFGARAQGAQYTSVNGSPHEFVLPDGAEELDRGEHEIFGLKVQAQVWRDGDEIAVLMVAKCSREELEEADRLARLEGGDDRVVVDRGYQGYSEEVVQTTVAGEVRWMHTRGYHVGDTLVAVSVSSRDRDAHRFHMTLGSVPYLTEGQWEEIEAINSLCAVDATEAGGQPGAAVLSVLLVLVLAASVVAPMLRNHPACK